MKFLSQLIFLFACSLHSAERPNILFAIADDWGWPHAGSYGDPVVKTPTFDRLAKEGALFRHAYVSSPSCTPSRGAILTGQWHWRLEGAGNLWSVFPDKYDTYPELWARAGYMIGVSSKGWGPGRTQKKGRQLAGPRYKNFRAFMKNRESGKPFCYWLGSSDPHRGYAKGSGVKSGMDLSKIKLFPHFPDSNEVRRDVADYYFEVQRFDSLVGDVIKVLEESGELDNTIVVMTGDHGMPFPRCKSNNYDSGARVPLATRWPSKVKAGTVVNDFVSLIDLAPTYFEAAGVAIPNEVSGRSLLALLGGEEHGDRGFVLHGKERHVPGQEAPDLGGYPTRALRTHRYLYLHNFLPDRWPAGTPRHQKSSIPGAWLADCDHGPTKTYMVNHKDKDDEHRRKYDLSFAKRPAYELYDLKKDPAQLHNIADSTEYEAVLKELRWKLHGVLKATQDPRIAGKGAKTFDQPNYLGGAPKFPKAKKTPTRK